MRDKPLLLDYSMRQLQYVIWELLAAFVLLILHRRASKSDLMAFLAAFMIYTSTLPISIVVAAPTRIKARDLLFHRVRQLLESKATPFIRFNKSDLQIINDRTGARIMFFACSEEHGSSARGHLANVLLLDEADEASAREWSESFLPMQQGLPKETAHIKYTIISGTPRGSASLLTQIYAKFKALAPDFSTIPGLTFKGDEHTDNTPLPPEAYQLAETSNYRVFHLSIEDTGLLDPEELESDRLIMGDAQFRREYFCDLEATADDVLFKLSDLVHTGTANKAHSHLNLSPSLTDGHLNNPDRHMLTYIPLSAGLDIGRSGDSTVLYIRQGHIPLCLREIKVPVDSKNMHNQIREIDKTLRRYGCTRIAADVGGLGQFFVDEMMNKLEPYDIEVQPVDGHKAPLYHWEHEYNNLRSNLYGLLAYAVKAHAPLPEVPLLYEELSATTTRENPNDKRVHLVSKKDIKKKINRSPDFSDAIAYSYFFDAQGSLEDYVATLRDIAAGRVDASDLSHLSAGEIIDRFPELYGDEDGQNDLDKFTDEIMGWD